MITNADGLGDRDKLAVVVAANAKDIAALQQEVAVLRSRVEWIDEGLGLGGPGGFCGTPIALRTGGTVKGTVVRWIRRLHREFAQHLEKSGEEVVKDAVEDINTKKGTTE